MIYIYFNVRGIIWKQKQKQKTTHQPKQSLLKQEQLADNIFPQVLF